jgi:hypothetical protein
MQPLTALDCVKGELLKIQVAQADCLSECGVVKNSMKYKYKLLIQRSNEFKAALDWLTNNNA